MGEPVRRPGRVRLVDAGVDDAHARAGTITAKTNSAVGVSGVAFDSPPVLCTALVTPAGVGLTSDISNSLNWIPQQRFKVISMSLGGGESATLRTAVQNATSRGVLLVAAAVDDLRTPGRDGSFGFGRVNLCAAMGGTCAYTPGTP